MQYVVDRVDSHNTRAYSVGLVGLYNYNARSRTAYQFAVGLETVQGSGVMIVASALLLRYAWPLLSLYKVCFEVPEYNLDWIRRGFGRYAVEEGRLVNQEDLLGRRWDVVIAAMYEDQWRTFTELIAEKTRRAE